MSKDWDLFGRLDGLEKLIRESIGGISEQISTLDKKLRSTGKKVHYVQKAQEMQQEELELLKQRVDELSRSDAAIWRSKDGHRTALDRDQLYKALCELGIPKRQAMLTLRDLGIIQPTSDGRLTCPVRDGKRGLIRAVVIFREED